jgi:hypothetical protein
MVSCQSLCNLYLAKPALWANKQRNLVAVRGNVSQALISAVVQY